MAARNVTPTIRLASIVDASELARMRWAFSAELARCDQDLDAFTAGFRPILEGYLSSGRWEIWVAEAADRLVGTVWVERVDKVPRPYERPDAWGYVTNVYVEPRYRNGGLGRRMLEAAIAHARAAGWELLLLWPSEQSGQFYARAGFVPSAEALELHVGDETHSSS